MSEDDSKKQVEEAMDESPIQEDEGSSSSEEVKDVTKEDSAKSEDQSEGEEQEAAGNNDDNEEEEKENEMPEPSEEESAAEEESEQSDADEKKTSSTVASGKRDRKKVERLSFSGPVATKAKAKVEPMGSGITLGDDPFIEQMIARTKADELKTVHRLLYNRAGTTYDIKKNLRCFNGYSFTKEDDEFKHLMAKISKMHAAALKEILRLFGQPVVGQKQELAERLSDFLLCPTAATKNVPAKKRKRSSSKKATKKRVSKTPKKGDKVLTPKNAGKKKATPKKPESDSDEESELSDGSDEPQKTEKPSKKATTKEPESDSDKENELSDGSEDISDEEEPAAVKATPKARKTPAKKTPAKKTPAKKAAKSTPAQKRKNVSDSDSDDEPLVKKIKKSEPTDDDIKSFLSGFIKSVDLEEVTMKSIYQKVYDQYPETDLTVRKEFIKETVKKMIA